MPEPKFIGNFPEDENEIFGLGVLFESPGIGRSYGVLLLKTRPKAQGPRRRAQAWG
jgi:hypothetical protein